MENMTYEKTPEEIAARIKELEQQRQYLYSFLETLYKGSDVKQKVDRELQVLKRQIDCLRWVIYKDHDLPF